MIKINLSRFNKFHVLDDSKKRFITERLLHLHDKDYFKMNEDGLFSVVVRLYQQRTINPKFAHNVEFARTKLDGFEYLQYILKVLKGKVYYNDSQIVNVCYTKIWGEENYIELEITQL